MNIKMILSIMHPFKLLLFLMFSINSDLFFQERKELIIDIFLSRSQALNFSKKKLNI